MVYVGITNNAQRRWNEHKNQALKGSNFYVHSAIRKYGYDNFQFQIIEQYDNLTDSLNAEIFWIEYLKYCGVSLYNMTDGGQTAPHTNYGIKRTQEFKDNLSKKFSGENNPFYGKHHTEETRLKCVVAGSNALNIRKQKLGKEYDSWYNESCAKKSAATSGTNNPFYGKKHSEESLRKMSDWQIGRGAGEANIFYGKEHTLETKCKISLSNTKLTKLQREQIIEERRVSGSTYQQLADKYNVSIQTIANVLKGKYAYLSV